MSTTDITVINKEINTQLADPATVRALVATTFKGFTPVLMKQAVMEGMIRGFSFRDFLDRNVYAIKYANGYSLMTSIDYSRKIGMRAGIVGKNAPEYEMAADEKTIISCTVTVKRKVGGYVGDYTAKVYFDEYSTGKNLWLTKPRTMIAKVAEMHALRMACPEELSQQYIEEEMESEAAKSSRIAGATDLVEDSELSMGAFEDHETTIQTEEESVDDTSDGSAADAK